MPVAFEAANVETVDTNEGTVATVLSGGVILRQRKPNDDLIELRADRVVLFTTLKSLRDVQHSGDTRHGEDLFSGAYLEGDVRIFFTPAVRKDSPGEQRMEAEQAYYEFATDRAVMTRVVMHSVNPQPQIPVIIRAKKVRQLAQGEYLADKAQLSTSSFAVPSYSINTDKVYVRQDPGATALDTRTVFESKDTTFRLFNTPLFYVPAASGSMTSGDSELRAIGFEDASAFGIGALSEWGLFEVLGYPPPRDLDLTFRADYYADRGPATGLNGTYSGGFVTENTKQAWGFEGAFHSYFVYDRGSDDIGRYLPPYQGDPRIRGEALWEHQHYFPDGWSFQARAGYVSDPTFLEQWFARPFDEQLPHDVSFYLKHQQDTEAFTLLAQFQPNDLVTTSDLYQEQFEVEHLPEVTYHRIGDSVVNDQFTFYSDNTISGLHFQKTRATLAQQGFFPYDLPGQPSLGTTGVTGSTIYRADFREEVDYPINAGQFKVVPYVVGRYTAYSDSPADGGQNRFFGGVGTKITTEFWKVDDSVRSELFDLHRMRHLIEPEINLFTSGTTVSRDNVFIYDEQIDPINDITAAQIALHQRWQTYRGGPGRWRSVDFLTLNVEADLFANKPSSKDLQPLGFRGLYYPSMPELSIPRNSINGDLTWRISDNTVLLSDFSQNLDKNRLATASIGLVLRRDEVTDLYVGNRYIADLNSNITTVALDYELSSKYTVNFSQSFDFGTGNNVETSVGVTRKFDAFFAVFRAFHNETTNQNGVGINVYPNGVGYGLNTDALNNTLNTRR